MEFYLISLADMERNILSPNILMHNFLGCRHELHCEGQFPMHAQHDQINYMDMAFYGLLIHFHENITYNLLIVTQPHREIEAMRGYGRNNTSFGNFLVGTLDYMSALKASLS